MTFKLSKNTTFYRVNGDFSDEKAAIGYVSMVTCDININFFTAVMNNPIKFRSSNSIVTIHAVGEKFHFLN